MTPPPPGEPGDPRYRVTGSARRLVLPLVPGLDRPPARRRPLPDAAAVRLVAVPDSAPPYDDERPAADPGGRRPPRRLSLATDARTVAPLAALAAAAAPAGQSEPRPQGRPAVPDPPGRSPARPGRKAARPGRAPTAEWPSRFAQVLAETLAGSRPQDQIVPWTTDQARRRIRQLGPMLAAGVQPRVRRVVTSQPADDALEMTVIVGFGPRVRALAVRLERDGPRVASPGRAARAARWVCTAIEAA
jgi:hypothetical protein